MSLPFIDMADAYQNGAYIPGAEGFPPRWTAQARAFRDEAQGALDLAYGDHPRARFDLFRPRGAARGLAVFVHGGYWMDFDKSSWSHLAAGAVARGWAVALPSYPLAPEVRLHEITRQVAAAISRAATLVDGPIHLSGHSAGGHLVARMATDPSPLPDEVSGRVERMVSISGLHDLRPLMLTPMNTTLHLDEEEATAESPALQPPLPRVKSVAWVGADERPEFLRQAALLSEAWRHKGADARLIAEPGRHHFNVIDGLIRPDHPLTECLVGD